MCGVAVRLGLWVASLQNRGRCGRGLLVALSCCLALKSLWRRLCKKYRVLSEKRGLCLSGCCVPRRSSPSPGEAGWEYSGKGLPSSLSQRPPTLTLCSLLRSSNKSWLVVVCYFSPPHLRIENALPCLVKPSVHWNCAFA